MHPWATGKPSSQSPYVPVQPTPGGPASDSVLRVKLLSRVRLFVTPWTAAYQAPPSVGFSRQEYWSGLLFPSPGDLQEIKIKYAELESHSKVKNINEKFVIKK